MRSRFSTQRSQARKAEKRDLLDMARKRPPTPAEVKAVTAKTGERTLMRGSGGRWYIVTPAGEWRRAPDDITAEAELYARRCETAKASGEDTPLWPARLTNLVQQFNKNS